MAAFYWWKPRLLLLHWVAENKKINYNYFLSHFSVKYQVVEKAKVVLSTFRDFPTWSIVKIHTPGLGDTHLLNAYLTYNLFLIYVGLDYIYSLHEDILEIKNVTNCIERINSSVVLKIMSTDHHIASITRQYKKVKG
jgi:hypothetical protein